MVIKKEEQKEQKDAAADRIRNLQSFMCGESRILNKGYYVI